MDEWKKEMDDSWTAQSDQHGCPERDQIWAAAVANPGD